MVLLSFIVISNAVNFLERLISKISCCLRDIKHYSLMEWTLGLVVLVTIGCKVVIGDELLLPLSAFLWLINVFHQWLSLFCDVVY